MIIMPDEVKIGDVLTDELGNKKVVTDTNATVTINYGKVKKTVGGVIIMRKKE